MKLPFLGKWSIQAEAGCYISLDAKTKILNVSSSMLGTTEKFNVYGTNNKFCIQALNGEYVSFDGKSYIANQSRDGDIHYFKVETTANQSIYLADLGKAADNATNQYLLDDGGVLKCSTSSPTDQNKFTIDIITVGLAEFTTTGFPAPDPDLSYAYLANEDLRNVFFTNANLSYSNLSEANIESVSFPTAKLNNANLSKVKANEASFPSADMTGVNLSEGDLKNALLQNVTLDNANMNHVDLSGASIENASLKNAQMQECKFLQASVYCNDFSKTDLTNSDFTNAFVRTLNFTDSNLTGVQIGNKDPNNLTIDLSDVQISSKTVLSFAQMKNVVLKGIDFSNVIMNQINLTDSKLDNSKFDNADLSYSNLTGTTITGNVSMHGANFSNASLERADLTGAQLGAISLLFRVDSQSQYNSFLNALNSDDVNGVKKVFKANGISLLGSVIISSSQYAKGRVWTIESSDTSYTVRNEEITGHNSLAVYKTVSAAILTNAFMKDAVLTSVNMYNVRASGVQMYGEVVVNGNAILEKVQLNNSNLSSINLKQALLYGVNFDYANLIGANLSGACLSVDSDGGQVSFNGSNLQGTNFTGVDLSDIIFTDSAVSVANQIDPKSYDGVWLFPVKSNTASLLDELKAASELSEFSTQLIKNLLPGKVNQTVINVLSSQGELFFNFL
jgi:uncharacterized protein YjbI with pentapeptide repeats